MVGNKVWERSTRHQVAYQKAAEHPCLACLSAQRLALILGGRPKSVGQSTQIRQQA